ELCDLLGGQPLLQELTKTLSAVEVASLELLLKNLLT
ncbi:transcriptional regulator, partial [Enterobacter hormaechei subsp. steigerwaltii]